MTALKLLLGLLPVALTAIGCLIVRALDRRKLARDPRLRAAIAAHPSMRARAIYKMPSCGQTIFGLDPFDLLAKQLCHEQNCLDCLANSNRESAA